MKFSKHLIASITLKYFVYNSTNSKLLSVPPIHKSANASGLVALCCCAALAIVFVVVRFSVVLKKLLNSLVGFSVFLKNPYGFFSVFEKSLWGFLFLLLISLRVCLRQFWGKLFPLRGGQFSRSPALPTPELMSIKSKL